MRKQYFVLDTINPEEINGGIICADGFRIVNVCDVDRIETL